MKRTAVRESKKMTRFVRAVLAAFVVTTVVCAPLALTASTPASIDATRFAGLHWRSIGPYRGGRAVAVAGVAGDLRTAYLGAVGGGLWKTENAGRTWRSVWPAVNVPSIGAIAVAPSDPNIVYVGSGEADMRSDIAHGNGMYRSLDAGVHWTHVGLDDSLQIGRIVVDPTDPRVLLVAALGHPYGPNPMRGVFRSTDGGATWTQTLAKDDDTGAIDLASDPTMHVVYASLWQTRRPPWSVYPPSSGPGTGLYRSQDGGRTWQSIAGNGFPRDKLGKIGLAVAPSDPRRVYAIVDARDGGLYRSDDAGVTWTHTNPDHRLWGRGWYFCHIAVDPRDPQSVYISNTSFYHSSDGGKTFTAIKGSPDGDDFHQIWIDPRDSSHLVLGSDQGASVSLDRGATWSSWFNQPTAQFYHIAADALFPYHLYGAQQDNGAAMVLSRSDHRDIEERDWRPITAGGESGEIAPDPHDPRTAYGTVGGGSDDVVREDLPTEQTRSISPTLDRRGTWRSEWTQPIVFGSDGALYATNQRIFRSRDRGATWKAISGDLARPHPGVPATLDAPTAADADGLDPRGVVYALAPSPRDPHVLWAGTDDGLVYRTGNDGVSWNSVTPPGITAWSHVSGIDASPFDVRAAYVAVDRHRVDDDRPYLYVTHDGGATWRSATAGLGDHSYVNAVRADPTQPGLLFAGTETGVYVSFNDGGLWQPLTLDMPTVSVRDLIVVSGDLAVATHGRGFWILDDIAPLRELARARVGDAHLFTPEIAVRMRAGNDEAEASPPETPVGENRRSGAFIDYVVPPGARTVELQISDARGEVVRRYRSSDPQAPFDPASVDYPAYWHTTAPRVVADAGMHRFLWNFRMDREDGVLAPPGRYRVDVMIDGRTFTQPLVVRRDPRIHATDVDLTAQAKLARAIDRALLQATPSAAANADPSTRALALGRLLQSVESADAAPTPTERHAWAQLSGTEKW